MKREFKATDFSYEEIASHDGRYTFKVLGGIVPPEELKNLSFEARIQNMIEMWGPDQVPALKEKEQKAREALKNNRSTSPWKINPQWKQYNDLYNEGGEGYNPYKKWL